MDSTDALIQAARKKDRQAIEDLLVQHLSPLESFLRLRMGPALRARLTAPDLVQSVCREVLEDLTEFEWRGVAAFRQWLYTRAQNKLMEKHRYHSAERRAVKREERAADTEGVLQVYQSLVTPTRVLAGQERVAQIEAAFDKLPEEYREAITLHRLCGLSHAEIAAQLGRSAGAVRNLVYRGLSKLALLVDDAASGPSV